MSVSVARVRLWCEIALHRHGWLLPMTVVVALASAAAAWGWIGPAQDRQDDLRHLLASRETGAQQLSGAASPQAGSAASAAIQGVADPLVALQGTLPALTEANNQLATVFEIAEQTGARLDRANYDYQQDRALPWTRVVMTLPVNGSYPEVRGFVESVLRANANMSLDQLSIKREAADKSRADVQLAFSAWYLPTSPADARKTP